MVREVRAAIGPDRELRLDANGGWTVPTARDALRRLDAYDIRYYEDPVETQEEMAALRPATRASFSSHLTDLRKAIALGAPDTIVSNVNEFGGIRRVGGVRPGVRAVRRRLPLPQRRDGHRQRRVPARCRPRSPPCGSRARRCFAGTPTT